MIAEKYPATEIKQATARLAELTQDQRTRMLLEARQIYEVDRRQERAFARREGREEAMEAAARKALADGLSAEAISSFTGLDIETIRKL